MIRRATCSISQAIACRHDVTKKQFFLSFVLAIELATVTIALHTIDCKEDHKYKCTSDEILYYLCPQLYEQ